MDVRQLPARAPRPQSHSCPTTCASPPIPDLQGGVVTVILSDSTSPEPLSGEKAQPPPGDSVSR